MSNEYIYEDDVKKEILLQKKEKIEKTKKSYRDKNKEKIKEQKKTYRDKNKEKIKEKNKEYYEKNKTIISEKAKKYYEKTKLSIKREKKSEEEIKAQAKKYRVENKDKLREKYLKTPGIKEKQSKANKKYREKNKDKLSELKKLWRLKNKEHIKEYKNDYSKNKRLNDPLYKLSGDIATMIRKSFYKNDFVKNIKTRDILGCDFIFFKEYIENQFEPWMNWSNHGKFNGEYSFGWDIDHIIELRTANTVDDIINLNHYTNLRPLDSKINRTDRNIEYYEKNKKTN
jgi:hypothetical protein